MLCFSNKLNSLIHMAFSERVCAKFMSWKTGKKNRKHSCDGLLIGKSFTLIFDTKKKEEKFTFGGCASNRKLGQGMAVRGGFQTYKLNVTIIVFFLRL